MPSSIHLHRSIDLQTLHTVLSHSSSSTPLPATRVHWRRLPRERAKVLPDKGRTSGSGKDWFLRANEPEGKIRRLENVLSQACSELEQGRNARGEIQTLQQKLDASVTSSQKADHGIQALQEALEASNNRVTDIHQQAVAQIEDLEEEAR